MSIDSATIRPVFLGLFSLTMLACASMFGLPSIAEQSQMIKANISSSSRVAVVTSAGLGSKELPRYDMAPLVVKLIAEETRKKLGAEVVALDQSENSDWAQAMKEGEETEFIRSLGFDAYVEVIFGESGWGGVLGSATNLAGDWQYEPGFWIFTVTDPGKRKMIKYTHTNSRTSCAVKGRKLLNYANKYTIKQPEKCAQQIADLYRKELMVTLAN